MLSFDRNTVKVHWKSVTLGDWFFGGPAGAGGGPPGGGAALLRNVFFGVILTILGGGILREIWGENCTILGGNLGGWKRSVLLAVSGKLTVRTPPPPRTARPPAHCQNFPDHSSPLAHHQHWSLYDLSGLRRSSQSSYRMMGDQPVGL